MTSPMTTPPQATEEALHLLEAASAEHLEWLKRIHCSLLFHEDDREPNPQCRAVEDGLAEKVCNHSGESHAAIERLKRARQHMEGMGQQLTQRAAEGERLDPETYMAFMAAVESYHAEGRQVELLLHQALAETDPLTGLLNRRGMMRDLRREWVRSVRNGEPCCLALVDLDHFKSVNDRHGHLAGDQVLVAAARFFRVCLRPYDLVYRFGGEEFLFCLPNTDLGRAKRVLDRLRLMMAKQSVRTPEGKRITVTISMGVAALVPQVPPETTIARSDHALYLAKTGGRNKICVIGETPDEGEDQPNNGTHIVGN